MEPLRTAALAMVIGIALAACGGDPDDPQPTSTTPAAVTSDRAATAIDALCEMQTATDLEPAHDAFYDRAHATLHDIAAAAAAADPGADAELLIAKQRVETALEEPELPARFGADVEALRDATATLLDTIGIRVAGCAGDV